jgi:hypothetical protein
MDTNIALEIVAREEDKTERKRPCPGMATGWTITAPWESVLLLLLLCEPA